MKGRQKGLSLLKPRVEIMDAGNRRGTACRAHSEKLMICKSLFQHTLVVPSFAAFGHHLPFLHNLLDNRTKVLYDDHAFPVSGQACLYSPQKTPESAPIEFFHFFTDSERGTAFFRGLSLR